MNSYIKHQLRMRQRPFRRKCISPGGILGKRCPLCVLICSLVITCFPASVRADEISDLENKTSSLSTQLNNINQEMVKISDEIASAKNQIEILNGEILRTQDSLAVAQADEAQRYQDMKARIKYMYEVGNASLLEMLFSAESMSDFLNKAEFIETISTYDRDMLNQLQAVRQDISEHEQDLLNQQASLEGLQAELEARRKELNETAIATSTDLATFNAQLTQLREEQARQEAARRAEEARRAEAARLAAQQKPVSLPAAADTASKPDADGSTDDKTPDDTEEVPDEDESDTPTGSGSTITTIDPSTVSASELDVFAAILECEAMQDHDSLLAVATVIMNRMYSSSFPNTVKEIVYASGQFEPVWTGRLDTVLSRGASNLSYQVAQEALGGAKLASVADCYYFLYAGSTNRAGVNVGNNLFFQSW